MFEAARVGDGIGHSGALAGMIAGTIVGGLIAAVGGIAAGALFMAGIASSCLGVGVLLVGLSFAVGWGTGVLAEKARDSIAESGASSMSKAGTLLTGSPNVFINSLAAVIATQSMAACNKDGPSMQVAQGSSGVFINGQPASRLGDKINCGASITEGSSNVYIGGEAQTTLPIKPEVPAWLYKVSDLTLLFAGLVGGAGGAFSKVGKLGRLLQKLPGINKIQRIACRYGVLMTAVAAGGIIARPIDVVSGQKFLAGEDELDFVLPSRLSVYWQRCWRSGNPGDSVLGTGWSLFWETTLTHYQDGLVWRAPSGDLISFPVVPAGQRTYCPPERRWLEHHQDDSWSVYGTDGEVWYYTALSSQGKAVLSRIADPCGNDVLFSWNADGTLQTLKDSADRQVTCRYRDGRLESVWLDASTCLVHYTYNAQGQLITVTGRGGSVRRRFSWQDDGLMSSHEDANGLLSEYTWREIADLPRVVAYRNSAGEQLTLEYDFPGRRRTARRDDGCCAQWELDEDDQVVRFTDYDGRETVQRYSDGELCEVILPGGASRRTTWDNYGRLLSETDPLGRETHYQWYRLTDNVTQVTYADGSSELNLYDELNRLVEETDALGSPTRYHYPSAQESLPDSVTDALGGTVKLAWDRQGLLTARTDCSGQCTTFEYDRYGQLLVSVDAEGHRTRREWDAHGQLASIIYPDGRRDTLRWNERGQLQVWRDAQNSEVRWQYNVLGQPVSVTDRLRRVKRWHYDVRGQLLRLENGNGAEYRFEYDAVGRLVSERRVDGVELTFRYDEAGHLCQRSQRGQAANEEAIPHVYQHDVAGQLVRRAHAHAVFHYQHDDRGRLVSLKREPSEAGLALGICADEVRLSYDAAGYLSGEHGSRGDIAYRRDALGNVSTLSLPDGDELHWLRYGSGHVSAVKFNHQVVSEFTRDRLHREITRTQGRREQQRTYDSLGRLTSQCSALWEVAEPEQRILSRALSYTASGELASVRDSLRGDVEYDYDAEGRLVKRADVHWQVHHRAYGYDAADNLRDAEDRHGIFPLADNRLLHWRNLWNQYDGQGNLTRRREGATEQYYQYDADNRLVAARGRGPQGEFVARYGYDALGRRTGKTVTWCESGKQEETHFLWEGYRLLQVRQPDRKESYVYDPTVWWSPLARITQQSGSREGDIRWFITDRNGAPLEMTDADGSVRWSGDYGSFGQLRGQTQDSEGLRDGKTVEPQPLRYAGQYADDETGLHYNLFRYYDPTVGRFTTQDPIGLAGGINLYQYAPNPLSWVDPWGLTPDRFPSWMETTRGYQRQHLIPYSLKEHPFFSRSGMDINGASNMMRLPVAPGIDPNPNLGLHRGWTAEHAAYNRAIKAELDALEQKAVKNNWDYRRAQREVLNLQHERRAGFKTGRYTCA
ncbi:RHS repeat-associated core domain-containing protein [Dickeya dianthicola]|uniref:RHS repeat-associated core domain-containing protein n=1 Tax=Dickeya dianthicola TaxID=204039 RepID=UPI000427D9E6|nr:RHS repeat-associated core domain-containing protein [Dickeya dianthicola]